MSSLPAFENRKGADLSAGAQPEHRDGRSSKSARTITYPLVKMECEAKGSWVIDYSSEDIGGYMERKINWINETGN